MAQSLHNLASLLEAKGDVGSAEPLYRQALALWETAVPPDHPDRRKTMTALAALLRAMGRDAEARELEARTAIAGPAAGGE